MRHFHHGFACSPRAEGSPDSARADLHGGVGARNAIFGSVTFLRDSPELYLRLLGLTLTLVGSMACAAATGAPPDVESPRISARVITALVNDPQIGARPIDVRVSRGVVVLSGRVHTQEEVARAVALAGAVPGVTRVDSSLTIGGELPPEPDAPPTGRQRAVRDPAVEFAELEESHGLFAVGASLRAGRPGADALESGLTVTPLLRFGSGAGFGPTMGFDWYGTTVSASADSSPASRLRVRPIMVGVAYTIIAGRMSVVPSLVGGYSFNRIAVPDTGTAATLAVDVRNSLAWRPGISVWIDTGRRTAANVSIGRLMTRLKVTYMEDGLIEQRSLNGHATMLSVGLAYKLF